METTVALLQTYAGRDKIMRSVSYAAMLLTAGVEAKSAVKLGTIARQISAARTVGRLFDDLLMWKFTKGYGLGFNERDPVSRVLQILTNIFNQCYFPIEHVAWAGDNNILSVDTGKLMIAGIGCWIGGLFCSILKSFRTIGRIALRRKRLIIQRKLESPEKGSVAEANFKESVKDFRRQTFAEVLNIIKNFSDLMNGVSWLPAGVLWGGKLTPGQNGAFGLVSSLLGLYQLIRAEKAKNA